MQLLQLMKVSKANKDYKRAVLSARTKRKKKVTFSVSRLDQKKSWSKLIDWLSKL